MIIKYNLSCFVGKVILNYASFDGNNFIAVKWEDKSKCSAGHYQCGKESEVQPEQELETPVTYTPCISCSQKHMGVWEGFILRNLCAGCMGVCGLAVWALVMWTPFTPLSISLFLLVSFSLSPPPSHFWFCVPGAAQHRLWCNSPNMPNQYYSFKCSQCRTKFFIICVSLRLSHFSETPWRLLKLCFLCC